MLSDITLASRSSYFLKKLLLYKIACFQNSCGWHYHLCHCSFAVTLRTQALMSACDSVSETYCCIVKTCPHPADVSSFSDVCSEI